MPYEDMSATFSFDLISCHVLVSRAEQSMRTPQHRLALLTRPFTTTAIRLATCGAAELDVARKWHSEHGEKPIAADIGHVSYARSSGPGGQNVNKYDLSIALGPCPSFVTKQRCRVNSKAQLRVSLDQLLPLLPPLLHPAVRQSRHVAERTNSILIQCDESRKQQANRDSCYRRLNELIMHAYHSTVPGETSDEQKKKVRGLQSAENEARLRQKKLLSSKKAARGKGRSDD